MKKRLNKKSLWRSLLSVMVFTLFILLAVGSYETYLLYYITGSHSFPGTYNETTKEYKSINLFSRGTKTIQGTQDQAGRWHGKVTFVYNSFVPKSHDHKEEVEMVHGKRNGKAKITRLQSGAVNYKCYKMGIRVDCNNKAALVSGEEISAFQVLIDKYPWYSSILNFCGFEDDSVESFMDTLEIVLNTYEFEAEEFDDYYSEVVEILEETPHDSIIEENSLITFIQGLEELKNSELRLAVIDRYRSDGNNTYDQVKTTYPGYLRSLSEGEVSDQDFKGFCHDLDSCLTSYGSLDPEDPFLTDSLDAWMFRALFSILELDTKKSASTTLLSKKNATQFFDSNDFSGTYRRVKSELAQLVLKSSPSEVAEVVLYLMFLQFDQADIIKQSVKKAYFANKGVISVPTITTEFGSNNSATSVTLNGYVIEDGGAAVTARGMAWASFYNPTTNDHSESAGSGIGDIAVTLTGLTEGDTYYARTYATNSAGTAYGNCIEFTAISTVSVSDTEIDGKDLHIYPNPTSAATTFSFQVESLKSLALTIVDIKGQVVFHHDLGSFPPGENQVELDLSGLQDGLYSCQLITDGNVKVARMLVIAR